MKKFETGDFRVIEDVILKEVFGRESRKEFSGYLLECFTKQHIILEDLKVWRDATLEKVSFDEKDFQADVVMSYHGIIYNIEGFTFFGKKGLFKTESYNGRLLSTQLDRGDDYDKIEKVIQFVIVEEVDIKLNPKVISKNLFSANNIPLSDLQEINIIRLDKIEGLNYNDGESDKKLLLLLRFLKAKNQNERDEIVRNGDEMLKKINEFIKRFMKSKRAKEKYIKYSSPWQFGEEYGMYKGRKEGITIGKDLGREEGIFIGKTQGRMEFARYLKKTGKNIEEISDTMEISAEEVKRLLNS